MLNDKQLAFVREYEALCRRMNMRITTSKDAPYYEGKGRIIGYTDPRLADLGISRQVEQMKKVEPFEG